jgi:NAD(P)-dependent dehydrogenase (short-subunit alcohol dehydrogenase family)
MKKLLDNKTAIVTGGGKELGFAIARGLAIDGAKVLVVSRSEESARQAVAKIEGVGGVAVPLVEDITTAGAADRIAAAAVERFGGIDILVNSAGVFVWKNLLDLTSDDWSQTIATNLSAGFFLTQAVAKVMIGQDRGGSIINITSIHGSEVDPNVIPHCASKFGLVGLTRATAEALRDHDIRVNAVAPGAIEPSSSERSGESPRQKVTQSDVANLVVYLASDLSRSVTGAVLNAYGSTRTVIKA